MLDPATRVADYNDISRTENTCAAYPVTHIPNALTPSVGGHPKTILFLSGYTSKLAGTERGVFAPEPNFSACFGSSFWPLPPIEHAEMLGSRLDEHDATCYLVNTGWSGAQV